MQRVPGIRLVVFVLTFPAPVIGGICAWGTAEVDHLLNTASVKLALQVAGDLQIVQTAASLLAVAAGPVRLHGGCLLAVVRNWGDTGRLQAMVGLRNQLLRRVRELAPDYFLSLDSDLLVAEDCLSELLASSAFGAAVGLRSYIGPVGSATATHGRRVAARQGRSDSKRVYQSQSATSKLSDSIWDTAASFVAEPRPTFVVLMVGSAMFTTMTTWAPLQPPRRNHRILAHRPTWREGAGILSS
jgi:hypothetical protein